MSILETPATRYTKNGRTDFGICSFYLGKKVAFVYRGTKEIRGSKIRVIWGKVTRPHGTYSPLRILRSNNWEPNFGFTHPNWTNI